MSIDVIRVVLPRLIFASALAGLGLVAVNAPAWAEVLKREGYYTDFGLRLSAEPQTVPAGHTTFVGYTVESFGPDLAEHPTLTLREDAGIRLLVESQPQCPRTGAQSVRCSLPALLPGQTLEKTYLSALTDPDARGLRLLSGFVSAETSQTGTGPGLDVDATWVQVVGQFNTGMQWIDRIPTQLPDGHLRWTMELDNAGPSSVIEGFLIVSASNGYRDTCRSFGGASCPEIGGRVYLPPDSRIQIDVDVPRTELDNGGITLFGSFSFAEGQQVGARPQFVFLDYLPAIFSGGFEQ
jgi:hypothetical protein